ncbi:hypothetical protein [Micromonospora sp. C28ISP2-4]|uniref:hypothetical protein n=1 Tax=Micromonospora sp. C28ISP2-4 TaxID=3059523 RepID=UPI00267764C4|nr:hypothetical protein [Micromonospora sp. C28ISP2-4]MDO3685743.1 hypothetical protein [Micromonospora sp. C28ISP2-4]
MGDVLAVRLGARLVFVTVVPNVFMLGALGFLLAAGAPRRRPSWVAARETIDGMSFRDALLIVALLTVVSLATHPLMLPLIQVVEGYWSSLPGGQEWENWGRERYRRFWHLAETIAKDTGEPENRRTEALRRMRWLPEDSDRVRATELGNVLYAGEVRAGARYQLRTDVAWPRLRRIIPEQTSAAVNDARNQLDASVRFCALGLLATVASLPMLIRYDVWLLFSFGLYLFAWGSYRAAVAAAKRFCQELAVAFDLHHLELWDALSLERPAHLFAERHAGDDLCEVLAGEEQIGDEMYEAFRYVAPQDRAPQQTDGSNTG